MKPDELSCVADAVRYIRAAREHVIDDPNPIETILSHYTEESEDATLDVRTVQRWLKRDDMKNVFSADVDADLIPKIMQFSARFYGRHFAGK